jgi:hypothetical protein
VGVAVAPLADVAGVSAGEVALSASPHRLPEKWGLRKQAPSAKSVKTHPYSLLCSAKRN